MKSGREALARLRRELAPFVHQHDRCEIEQESDKGLLMRLGEGEELSYLEVNIGSFEFQTPATVDWDYEMLVSDRDVDRVLAMCDAVVAGRGVTIEGPKGYPTRTWLFLDSHGFKEAMTATATALPCRRARSIPKGQWRRRKFPDLRSRVT